MYKELNLIKVTRIHADSKISLWGNHWIVSVVDVPVLCPHQFIMKHLTFHIDVIGNTSRSRFHNDEQTHAFSYENIKELQDKRKSPISYK